VLEFLMGEEFRVALVNAAVLALWAMLPGLLLGFALQSLAARRTRPEFSLRKSEVLELKRAIFLHRSVHRRLEEIAVGNSKVNKVWRMVFRGKRCMPQDQANELEDLEAHARYLRQTIIQLKGQPLKRLEAWVQILTWRSAFGRSAAAHLVTLAVTVVAFHYFQRPLPGDQLTAGVGNLPGWYPFDQRLFYANSLASGLAVAVVPLFMLMRRRSLRREYFLELYALRDLAGGSLAQVINYLERTQADQDSSPEDLNETGLDDNWASVLGLSKSATTQEIKDRYKALIKQNHPDKVNGMSPALIKLAEAQTQKLNIAYTQALFPQNID
jgi:DnaJ domain